MVCVSRLDWSNTLGRRLGVRTSQGGPSLDPHASSVLIQVSLSSILLKRREAITWPSYARPSWEDYEGASFNFPCPQNTANMGNRTCKGTEPLRSSSAPFAKAQGVALSCDRLKSSSSKLQTLHKRRCWWSARILHCGNVEGVY